MEHTAYFSTVAQVIPLLMVILIVEVRVLQPAGRRPHPAVYAVIILSAVGEVAALNALRGDVGGFWDFIVQAAVFVNLVAILYYPVAPGTDRIVAVARRLAAQQRLRRAAAARERDRQESAGSQETGDQELSAGPTDKAGQGRGATSKGKPPQEKASRSTRN